MEEPIEDKIYILAMLGLICENLKIPSKEINERAREIKNG